jgi:hypothetical protein
MIVLACPGRSLYLLQVAHAAGTGGSIVAVGTDGALKAGWPVVLRRAGAGFSSVAVGTDGTAFALAVEPEEYLPDQCGGDRLARLRDHSCDQPRRNRSLWRHVGNDISVHSLGRAPGARLLPVQRVRPVRDRAAGPLAALLSTPLTLRPTPLVPDADARCPSTAPGCT